MMHFRLSSLFRKPLEAVPVPPDVAAAEERKRRRRELHEHWASTYAARRARECREARLRFRGLA